MTTVTFNDLDEFIAELVKDRTLVDRNLVRLTCQHRAHTEMPITYVSVIAMAQVGGYLVKLGWPIGDFMRTIEDQRQRVAERAEQILNTLQSQCADLGLETRAGLLADD